MKYFNKQATYKPNKSHLKNFLKQFWFIPSDVLLRSIEASIWDYCLLAHPILDIGVGDGGVANLTLKKHAPIDVGIDLNPEGLPKARKTHIYKKVIQADATNMNFKNDSFASVISNSTFEHIAQDEKAVAEVGRILKKGGHFYLTVPSAFLPKYILELEGKKDKINAKNKLEKFNKRTAHFHYRSLGTWEKLFKKNNMKVIFHKYYFSKSVSLAWYKILVTFTKRIGKSELWSLIGASKITRFLPMGIIIFLEMPIINKFFDLAFFTEADSGGMLFIIGEKK
jgi:demethylmenaquinone methyltransferase/2-methoxy-6-polyprenyl-1,4-benzoquinol methylase